MEFRLQAESYDTEPFRLKAELHATAKAHGVSLRDDTKNMRLSEVAKRLGALAPESLGEREPLGYSIDSRTLRAGDLFFAIRGERHDGHRFVAEVFDKGALAAVVSREFQPAQVDRLRSDARLIGVDDTLAALQQLAAALLRDWRGQAVAVTGSMGKTTTKEMTAAA